MVSLQNNKDIMIAPPANKGRAAVVMNTNDYKAKVETLLSDDKAYNRPLRANIRTSLLMFSNHSSVLAGITDIKYKQLYPTSEEVPKFYGLPKVHKNSMPLRPIVACRGAISYETAKFTADIIGPLVGQSPHYFQNSKDLV